ncbi:hypothetical protein GN156_28980, partial [bacterium LRH843]|nr:hypothetical protein [bacterium LRH843]
NEELDDKIIYFKIKTKGVGKELLAFSDRADYVREGKVVAQYILFTKCKNIHGRTKHVSNSKKKASVSYGMRMG